jgi:hypothetical protein
VNLKVQAVPLVHFSPAEFKVFRGPFAREMIPAVREKHSADIHE